MALAVARSGSLKSGKTLTETEMKALVKDLMQCQMPYYTQNGKIIILKMGKDEIDRRFQKG
jgi:DNA mismatch repair ATPase MutL